MNDHQSLQEEDSSMVEEGIETDQDKGHAIDCVSTERRNRGALRKSTVGGWTDEEDARLEEAVREYNGKTWKMIATKLPGRTDVQCLHRWQKVLNPNLIKGAWTKAEDGLIVALVSKHGEKHWSLIAQSLPGRIGKQCRERWNNYLKPGIVRTPWTEQEDSILLEAHREYGNKWAELTKLLPGRSENAIKNHWNCTLSKRVNEDRNKGKRKRASVPSNPGEIDYVSSFTMIDHNVGTIIPDPTTQSVTRDYLSEQANVTDHVDSSSGLSIDFVSGTVTENSPSTLHDTRLSLEVSCSESLPRSAADCYKNFPSIIRKRGVATSGIMLFGKRLDTEFDAADADEDDDEVALRL